MAKKKAKKKKSVKKKAPKRKSLKGAPENKSLGEDILEDNVHREIDAIAGVDGDFDNSYVDDYDYQF